MTSTFKIGVVEKNRSQYWAMVNAGWHDAAAALGLAVDIEAPEQEDVAEQITLMRRQLDRGVDALAFVATRPDAFDEVVSEASERGVPVVTFDLDAPASGRLCFVGMPSLRASGGVIAERLLADLPPGSTVIAQTGTDSAHGAVQKLGGFCETATAMGHEVVIGDNDHEDLQQAFDEACRLLDDHPDAAAMFGVYSYHPLVQAKALRARRGIGALPIAGYDMLPETVALIESGEVRFSMWIQEYYFGFYTALAVSNLLTVGLESLGLYGMRTDVLAGNALYPELKTFDRDNVGEFAEFSRRKDLARRVPPSTVV